MKKSKDYSILVNSCDSYEDTWIPFFQLLYKYSNFNCPVYLNTEKKQFDYSNIITLNQLSDCEWGYRFRKALERVSTEYCLILLDDFFIRSEVNIEEIERCIDIMKRCIDISVFYFMDTGRTFRNEFIEDVFEENYLLAKEDAHYRLNLQAGIWRRSDLISLVNDFDTPWSWEVLGSKYMSCKKNFIT